MAAMLGIEHVTRAGERLDLLAWRYYGDAARLSPIVEANPSCPLTPMLPSGLTLVIPVQVQESAAAADALPPWKR